jgi:hypothetical protein
MQGLMKRQQTDQQKIRITMGGVEEPDKIIRHVIFGMIASPVMAYLFFYGFMLLRVGWMRVTHSYDDDDLIGPFIALLGIFPGLFCGSVFGYWLSRQLP